ncbi:MAG: DUF4279 domain-containing protein [Nitrospira sp.]|nr:DUF4279 domain-containing protein [Nitrospira sp.]
MAATLIDEEDVTEHPQAPIISTILWLGGEGLDPEEFTLLVGLQPTWSGKNGELSSNPMAAKRGVRVQETFWRIEIEQETYSMDEGIQDVLTRMWPYREKVRAYRVIRPNIRMGVTSVIHINQDRPVYDISLDSITKLAELGCSFMIDDIYQLEETEN